MIFSIIASLIALFSSSTQEEKTIFYHDFEYEAKVNSVLLRQNGGDERFPIFNLGRTNALNMSFDMLEPENDYFQYTFIHCDKNWNPSSLNSSDYLKGTTFEEIVDFKFASNTFVQYTHYNFTFPNADMQPRLAGNYLLKVYRNYDEEDVILTRRFMVINDMVKVTGSVRSATNVGMRFTHQEIDFEVDAKGFTMPNPFQDLHAVIVKNYAWMQATVPIKPQFANSNRYIFNYEKENVVEGINEFRFFDVRGLRTFSGGVKSKYFDTLGNQLGVVLFTDPCRGGRTYEYWLDNNGKTVYGNRDLEIENSEDYLQVNFVLKPNALFNKEDRVFVLGEFNNWQPTLKHELLKNKEGLFTSNFSLKQGYYNYLYVIMDKDGNLSFDVTEGQHMETENDYRVLIYHKNQFLQYDELVGLMYLNTLNANTKD